MYLTIVMPYLLNAPVFPKCYQCKRLYLLNFWVATETAKELVRGTKGDVMCIWFRLTSFNKLI
jgi:hypothetical protein